jgi:glycosyltransferase involved in cell wall biosynthesis
MQTFCLIIPCYNEAARLDQRRIEKYLAEGQGAVLVFVNDGSTDNTSEKLHKLRDQYPERIFTIDLESNSGKAKAIREGMLLVLREIRPAFVGYMDADLSTPLSEMNGMFSYLDQHEGVEVIFGSRVKRLGSRIERTPARHYFGRVFATFVSILLQMPVYDSQCGAKVMTAEKAEMLFREDFITSWLFDIELLYRYKILYGTERTLREVCEYPLSEWTETPGSKIRFIHVLSMPFDLVKIYLHYRKGKSFSVLTRE